MGRVARFSAGIARAVRWHDAKDVGTLPNAHNREPPGGPP